MPTSKREALGFLAVLAVLGAQTLAGQTPQVFRGGVDLVHLDVSVLDNKHRPVLGLSASDFTILEDGKPQAVDVFDAVTIETPPPPLTAWMRDVTSDVTTNSLAETRLFVIVIDDACTGGAAAIASTKQIVQDVVARLGPKDLTAVVFTASNRDAAQDFTNDPTKLLSAASHFVQGWGCSTYFQEASASTLSRIADYLVSVPQRRKALIWISSGIPVNFAALGPQPMAGTMAGREQAVGAARSALDMLRHAQLANVAIYPIDPNGLRVPPSGPDVEFLLTAASNTGGRAVVYTNDFLPGIEQIFRENSSYYVLGFRSSNPKPDTYHRLQVKVNRADVEVRTREGYTTPAVAKPGTVAPSPLAEAISGLLPNPGLPLRVAVAPFAIPGDGKAAVTIALGVRQPIPAVAANARITETTELQTSAFSPEGTLRGTARHTAKVTLRMGANGEAVYEALGRIDLSPGRYRLRLAAHNPTSQQSGSVFADVDIPDFARLPFSMSGVIVTSTPGLPAAPKDLFKSLLPSAPTARRAIESGRDRGAVDRLLSGLSPDERVIELDQRQPEFVSPVWDYVTNRVTERRISDGLSLKSSLGPTLRQVQERYGVDENIILGIWGLESNYGDVDLNYTAAGALATLAYEGRRRAQFEGYLLALIEMVERNLASAEQLQSSWAGALGQPQFMPDVYLTTAVDWDNDGHRDIWGNRGDVAASIANYLADRGWRRGEPVFDEVSLPDDFDYALADGTIRSVADWATRGVRRIDRQDWSSDDRNLQSQLFLPAGAEGPALLLHTNFGVIRRYNASDRYALVVALLARAFEGRGGLVRDWPTHVGSLNRDQTLELQTLLNALGYDAGSADGLFGSNTRRAVRAFQTATGQTADGFPTAQLLDAVRAQARR